MAHLTIRITIFMVVMRLLTRKVEEDKEDTAVKLDRSMELELSVVEVVLTGMFVLLVFTLLE